MIDLIMGINPITQIILSAIFGFIIGVTATCLIKIGRDKYGI